MTTEVDIIQIEEFDYDTYSNVTKYVGTYLSNVWTAFNYLDVGILLYVGALIQYYDL